MQNNQFSPNNFDRELQKQMGIPYQYRGNFPMPTPVSFLTEVRYGVKSRVISRSSQSQTEQLQRWAGEEFLTEPMSIGYGSDHLDTHAMRAAVLTARYQSQYYEQSLKFYNCASLSKIPEDSFESQFLVLYNITPDVTRFRLQAIRDIITSHSDSVILAVIAGCSAVEFFNDYLKLPISYAIHFGEI